MTKYWHFVVCTHSVASFIVPCLPFPASKQPWTNYRLQFYWVNYLSCWTNKTNGPVFTLSIICDENVARLSTNNWTYNNAISYLYLLMLANVRREKITKRKWWWRRRHVTPRHSILSYYYNNSNHFQVSKFFDVLWCLSCKGDIKKAFGWSVAFLVPLFNPLDPIKPDKHIKISFRTRDGSSTRSKPDLHTRREQFYADLKRILCLSPQQSKESMSLNLPIYFNKRLQSNKYPIPSSSGIWEAINFISSNLKPLTIFHQVRLRVAY